MNFSKTHILSAAILLAGFQEAKAQGGLFLSTSGAIQGVQLSSKPFEFVLRSDAFYRQDPNGVNFTGGQLSFNLRDGQVLYDGLCGSTEYVAPGQVGYPIYGTNPPLISGSPCAGGTSGFISAGDFNNDGVPDPGAYLAVSQINRAVLVEPKRPDKVMLVAAPPSLLPRPSAGFSAQGALLFYNIQTTQIRQFPLSQYFFRRVFGAGERKTFDNQIVQGTYKFTFPQVGRPDTPVPISIDYFGAVDGFRTINNQKRGFRFLNFKFVGGFARIDPTVPNTIRWEGNTPDKVSLATDQTFFSIRNLAIQADPLSDPGAGYVFPPFVVPATLDPRIQLPTPIDTSYTLPPGLIPVGTTGLLQVTLKRNRGAVISDFSETTFSIPVEFGFLNIPPPPPLKAADVIASQLPPTATAADKAYNNDFDGDGMTNFAEWVFNSNPGDASSVPVAPRLAFEVPSTDGGLSGRAEGSSGGWVFRVAKRENTDPALTYAIERSTDMNEWIKVTNNDPNWQLVETASEIKVVSRTPDLNGGNFFRASAEVAR